MRTGEFFIKKGKISPAILETALKIQKITHDRIGKILIELGKITKDELIEYLSEYNPEAVIEEKTIMSTLPIELFRKHHTIALSETSTSLYIAGIEAGKVKETLSKTFKKRIDIKPVGLPFLYEQLRRMKPGEDSPGRDPSLFLSGLIKEAVDSNVSDIHIESMRNFTAIRFRLDGVLRIRYVIEKEPGDSLIAVIKGIADMDIAEKRFPQDGSFLHSISETKDVYVRVSSMPSVDGEVVVMRILDRDKVMVGLDELGITKIDDWKKAIANRDGVILVTGPTGSGKSTTLYATMLYLNRFETNVITIEDPVEYRFPFIRQVQVNEILNLDFAAFLKHSLRQDPDVIIVGEVRDEETAKTMMRAAETGHLVFATLHSNNIATTFSRLMDLGVRVGDLKYLLRCIVSQALLRRLCPECTGKGCEGCSHTGYRGRVLVSELELFTPEKVELFLSGKIPSYHTMIDDAIFLMKKGLTDRKEIERVFGIRADT